MTEQHHKRSSQHRVATAMAMLVMATSALAQPAVPAQPAPVDQGYLVRWRDSALVDSRVAQRHGAASDPAAATDSAGGRRLAPGWHRLAAPAYLSASAKAIWLAQWRADPRVAAMIPNVREHANAVIANDSLFAQQWWLAARSAATPGTAANTGVGGFSNAWTLSTGNPVSGMAPVIAILDSGITAHPDLDSSRILPGYDFVSDASYSNDGNGADNDPTDPGDAVTVADQLARPDLFGGCAVAPSSWHGTLIAGQIAALTNNGQGVAAADWFARVLPVRVAGKCGAHLADIIDGMRWAAGLAVVGAPINPNPARIVVVSYGGTDPCDAANADPTIAETARLYQQTIAEIRAVGAMVIVAAGNQRSLQVGRPASCPGAFAVAALNREGFKANYSSFGAEIALSTPGGDMATGGACDAQLADSGLVSTTNQGRSSAGLPGYAAASGTSFAAPAVAAAAALMLAVNPALTLAQLEAGLRQSARPHVQAALLGNCSRPGNVGRCACTTASCGAGLLDVEQALAFAASPLNYSPPVRPVVELADSRIQDCSTATGRSSGAPVVSTPTPVVTETAAASGGGGGGGAIDPVWIVGLALAITLLAALRRERGSQDGVAAKR